ncbi:pheromone alpha factor receptor [Friedmanniomyces endolithicus]|uniref:Pheromone alpha factor receptor n=1 Tax=Friedmanniomyces endolithicus TaxID=329885 RepID=A0AAN6FHB9_9PEZI|nr:pheromone alpha factor receptor [Friedmanniomyces endolithicus]KAK0280630.1 pheromone alpha factor receptor [Friedmanniomyces endolithicus]KAK0317506.1 pheromone alpha factor receptor [Friedmanniomyces endolithicus]KAK0983196.1 pheromone alpha factor receptor [Friedmanniomyces endolithicus]
MAHLTWLADTTFDPYNQTFILAGPDGTTAYPASVVDILTLNTLCISQSIIFGVQVGITGLLAVILMLMTKRDKRQSAVFLLNAASLLAIFIRNVLACIALNSLFYNFYNWELHYYPVSPALTRAMDINATAEVLGIIINALIYSSLVLQIRIVCCTLTHTAKIGIVVVSAIVAFTALTIRFALAVLNIEYNIFGIDSATAQQFQLLGHVAKANNVITVVAIAFFSAIFVVKLAFAIHLRRKLNMKQFGPMQIIFVMGCQTMFVPLIFAVVSYYTVLGIQINSLVPTVVAIFLPLSGMWASAQTANEKLVRSKSRFHRAVPVGATELSSAKAYGSTKTSDTADTLIDDDLDEDDNTAAAYHHHGSGRSRTTAMRSEDTPRGGVEMGMVEDPQRLKTGAVVVDRTYSVRSD